MISDSGDVDVATVVNVGDTVSWDWVGVHFHTTTACSGSDFTTCDAAFGWGSPVMNSGNFTHTFTTAGTFYYKCILHPTQMRGQITVLAATPIAVGGIVELSTDADAQSEQAASNSRLPLGASVAIGALLVGAGGLYLVRVRRG